MVFFVGKLRLELFQAVLHWQSCVGEAADAHRVVFLRTQGNFLVVPGG